MRRWPTLGERCSGKESFVTAFRTVVVSEVHYVGWTGRINRTVALEQDELWVCSKREGANREILLISPDRSLPAGLASSSLPVPFTQQLQFFDEVVHILE